MEVLTPAIGVPSFLSPISFKGRADNRVLFLAGYCDSTFCRVFINSEHMRLEGEYFNKSQNCFVPCSVDHPFSKNISEVTHLLTLRDNLRLQWQGVGLVIAPVLLGGGQMCATERKDADVQSSRVEETVEVVTDIKTAYEKYEEEFQRLTNEMGYHLESSDEYEKKLQERDQLVLDAALEVNDTLKRLVEDRVKNYHNLLEEALTKIFNLKDNLQLFDKTKSCFKIAIRGYGRLEFDEGTYEGSWDIAASSGKGSIVYSNGERYVGKWIRHDCSIEYADSLIGFLPHGSGKMIYEPDARKGDSELGTITSTGASTTRGGIPEDILPVKFSGHWIHGEKHGRGKETYSDGSYYEGAWAHNHREGTGREVSPKGITLYDGQYERGVRNGHGKLFNSETGQVAYSGDIVAGVLQGKGTLYWATGDKYTGDIVDGEAHGQGVYEMTNREKYSGSVVEGEKQGYGEYLYRNGDVYKGEWSDGLRHGSGELQNADGAILHQGFWEDDEPA